MGSIPTRSALHNRGVVINIQQKIDKVVDIWVEEGSLVDTKIARNRKYDDINEKMLNGLYVEEDLDKFINRYKK